MFVSASTGEVIFLYYVSVLSAVPIFILLLEAFISLVVVPDLVPLALLLVICVYLSEICFTFLGNCSEATEQRPFHS